jgi:hypothetical protein
LSARLPEKALVSPYSPKCLEGLFCELHPCGALGIYGFVGFL